MATVTRVLSKKATQQILRDLRRNGYCVKRDSLGGYSVYVSDLPGDTRVLMAMPGSRGYLVRYEQELLTEG